MNFHAQTFDLGRTALHAVAAQVTIDHGVLTVPSLSATLAEGKLGGHLRFDATHEVPTANLDLRIGNLRLGQFAHKNPAEPPIDGLLQARVILNGRGGSIHQLASTANGTVAAVVPHGTIRASFAELTGIDVTRALGLVMRKDRKETPVRCGIASFQVHDGTATAESLVVDTDPVLITGKGEIHLDAEICRPRRARSAERLAPGPRALAGFDPRHPQTFVGRNRCTQFPRPGGRGGRASASC